MKFILEDKKMLTVQNFLTTSSGNLSILDFLDGINNFASIVVSILGGICALKGINYLRILRQKKADAVFSFESQLYVRIYQIRVLIGNNEFLFTNLFSETAKESWGDKSAAHDEKTKQLYENVKETLDYIKEATDQMPAYKGWVNDYAELIKFLTEVIHFNICDPRRDFKYTTPCDESKRTSYFRATRDMLDRLLTGIKEDQNKYEGGIFR